MKLNEIISSVKKDYPYILKQGSLNEKVLLELKMNTSLFEHIEVVIDYYDDDEMPGENNWTDVEGMGYGWRWLHYDKGRWHEMMCKIVAEECEGLLNNINKVYYIIAQENEKKIYHLITLDEYRTDTIVTLSNEELFY